MAGCSEVMLFFGFRRFLKHLCRQKKGTDGDEQGFKRGWDQIISGSISYGKEKGHFDLEKGKSP